MTWYGLPAYCPNDDSCGYWNDFYCNGRPVTDMLCKRRYKIGGVDYDNDSSDNELQNKYCRENSC